MVGSDLQKELKQLRRDNAALRRQSEQLERQREQLEQQRRQLEREKQRLQRQNERLKRDKQRLKDKITQLQQALDRARRAGKRQAAPFSKGEPKNEPRRPGRRSGKHYGRKAWRRRPKQVDEIVDAPLPERCPHCDGPVEPTRVAKQFQTELPQIEPQVTQFNVHIGHCVDCGRRIQGRHPRQSSDALGAAASQIGPRTLALAAELNKGGGLSFNKLSRLFNEHFGMSITAGGLCLGLHRLARAAQPTYNALIRKARASPIVVPDETGWKVGGRLQWL